MRKSRFSEEQITMALPSRVLQDGQVVLPPSTPVSRTHRSRRPPGNRRPVPLHGNRVLPDCCGGATTPRQVSRPVSEGEHPEPRRLPHRPVARRRRCDLPAHAATPHRRRQEPRSPAAGAILSQAIVQAGTQVGPQWTKGSLVALG